MGKHLNKEQVVYILKNEIRDINLQIAELLQNKYKIQKILKKML